MMIEGHSILVGVSGGIAAYKTPDLVRRLRRAGGEVRVMMTGGAEAFVTPLTLQAVSGQPVRHTLLDPNAESGMDHIELARWADLVLIAPATANLIARLAHGLADDLVTTVCLATNARLALAPAMNRVMWDHPATRDNVRCLEQRGVVMLGPDEGAQACGEFGEGRMMEVEEISEQAALLLAPRSLNGVRVMVTSGPTWEPLDPVRGISNRSSGRMGHALATAAIEAGAELTLVSGPGTPSPPPYAHSVPVVTGCEMDDAVQKHIADTDIFIGVAAVSDYRPLHADPEKRSKSKKALTLELAPNPDILANVAARKHPPFTVGFAAETSALTENALAKLERKKLDMICANRVGDGLAIGTPDNALTVLGNEQPLNLGPCSKALLARQLIREIARRYHAKHCA